MDPVVKRNTQATVNHRKPIHTPLWKVFTLKGQWKYHLQNGPVWKILLCCWKNLISFILLIAFMAAVAFLVHLLKSLKDPSPTTLFNAVAVCFGIIAEILLINCLIWYCRTQYSKAKMLSYSIKPRTIKQCGNIYTKKLANLDPSSNVCRKTMVEKQKLSTSNGDLDLKITIFTGEE
ncbi:hypothetical protein GDO86_007695 [Hymenochirus boettgeri]|uniref:Uncharacterized protein n=1 Tax=Hymenochirus boettgeri TaxID=247094 RepID=A0A8T2IUP7_9PIPI|nr:hypothetical protein GDO86_007695 [Hymenochirus boettgeri]